MTRLAQTLGLTEIQTEILANVRSFVDTAAFAPLKIVADTANGMGGLVVPAAFAGLHLDRALLGAGFARGLRALLRSRSLRFGRRRFRFLFVRLLVLGARDGEGGESGDDGDERECFHFISS